MSHLAVSILIGTKTLELRPSTVDKSTAVLNILEDVAAIQNSDFVLCLGDGKTDECVFSTLSSCGVPNVSCVTVGRKQTCAKYYVEGVRDAIKLVSSFVSN